MLFMLEWNFKFMNLINSTKWNSVSNQWKSETLTLENIKNTDESFLSSMGWDLLNFVDVLVVCKKGWINMWNPVLNTLNNVLRKRNKYGGKTR